MFNPGNFAGFGGFQPLPGNGDLVALRNGAGGYIGGVRRKDKLLIVPHCKEWEHFYFEAVDNDGRFALRQKVSNHYIGGSENVGHQLFLSPSRDMSEIFTYNLLPNGMVAIINVRNSRLGKNKDRAIWSNQNTMSESWSFEVIYKSNNTLATSSSVVAIQSANGGFIGGVRSLHLNLGMVKKVEGWEKFILEPRNNEKWAFKQQISGFYIGKTWEKGDKVVLTNVCESCEEFELVPLNQGWIGIKNSKGSYMRADGQAVRWHNGCANGDRWKLVPYVVSNQFQHEIQEINNTDWIQNQNVNWGPNQGQQGWNQGHGQGQWNQGSQGQWNQQGNQGQWNQGQNQWNQGHQGTQGQWNRVQSYMYQAPGQNQSQSSGLQQSNGFISSIMSQSRSTSNQFNDPFSNFQGGFSSQSD